MSSNKEKRRVGIVTACMQADGTPTFVRTKTQVTPDEFANGIHYYLAEADLLLVGYEEPFGHFDQDEAPPFLHPAVQEFLANSAAVLQPVG